MKHRCDIGKIRYTLNRRPYLELMETSVGRIPERIRRIEEGYFICYNKISGKFEVHSTMNEGDNTFCFVVPYPELDDRTLAYCLETNIGIRGDDIVRDLEAHNAKLKRSEERAKQATINDIARDMSEVAAYGVDEDKMHKGYSKIHVMTK